jgi:hypothetical protein
MSERPSDSLYGRFANMHLLSSNQSQSRLRPIAQSPQLLLVDNELTPVIEEQTQLKNTSTVKKPKFISSRGKLAKERDIEND